MISALSYSAHTHFSGRKPPQPIKPTGYTKEKLEQATLEKLLGELRAASHPNVKTLADRVKLLRVDLATGEAIVVQKRGHDISVRAFWDGKSWFSASNDTQLKTSGLIPSAVQNAPTGGMRPLVRIAAQQWLNKWAAATKA